MVFTGHSLDVVAVVRGAQAVFDWAGAGWLQLTGLARRQPFHQTR